VRTLASSVLAVSLVFALAACGSEKASGPPQQLTVTATDAALQLTGADSLRNGLVTITVRNSGKGAHALLISRLKKELTQKEIVATLDNNKIEALQAAFEAKGGIPDVPPGDSWQETVDLQPGTYVLADYGYNGTKLNYQRGLIKTIEVGSGGHKAVPPATIGKIEMKDFAFDFSLPKPFNGKGVIEVTNTGEQAHEITLVSTPPGRRPKDVLAIVHSGAIEPPDGYAIDKVLAILDPGNTAYVRFDLPPGHYVALCLVVDPKQKKLHADLGQVGEFDVR
jgi:predicted small lipoprotein YifL